MPSITVTTLVAVKPPSTVFTVIVALPAATGVTTPFTTVATAASEVDHVTDLFVALAGATVATNVSAPPPTVKFNVDLSSVTPVTAISVDSAVTIIVKSFV